MVAVSIPKTKENNGLSAALNTLHTKSLQTIAAVFLQTKTQQTILAFILTEN
jgi:hypothetical protein